MSDADLCILVVDARGGITAGDETIAQTARRAGRKTILVANKCEGRVRLPSAEAWRLGLGDAVAVSAEHGLGVPELCDAILAALGPPEAAGETADASELNAADRPLRLAIVGRPNVGKSSLFNRLLGSERSLTGPEAGITRDAIEAGWQIDGRKILLHDTAGLRKRARAVETLERLAVASTLDAIKFADCVIVVIDISAPFEKQDLTIADLIEREGRAAVFAVNKWDLVENRAGAIGRLRERLDHLLPQLAGAPLVAVSALTGEGLDRLGDAIVEADRAFNRHVGTADLNRFLESALSRHAPPAIRGRSVRIRYMTQPKARPPTFALFGNQLKSLPPAYLRYLQKGLREAFGLQGAPIRFLLRGSKNPYA
jgi:GTP-binding protein